LLTVVFLILQGKNIHMILRFLFVFIGISISFFGLTQTLTISSSGQIGTSGTTWNLTGSTLTVTGTANIQSSVFVNALNSGDLTVVGSTNTFVVNVNENITSTTVGSDLTIGSVSNTGTITVTNNITIAGGLTLRGGYVNVNANITSSATGDIFLKGIATNNPSVFLQSGKIITKSGGTGTLTFQGHSRVRNSGTITTSGTGVLNVVLWSDFDNSNNDGGVSHFGTISTNGGHVWMGGSNNNGGSYTWNGLTVGDGPSIGSNGYNANAMDIFGPITTNGGDLLLWANMGNGSGYNGIVADNGHEVNVGNGDIILVTPYVLGEGPSLIFRQSGGTFTLVPNGGAFPNALDWTPILSTYLTLTGWNFPGNFNYLWLENPTQLTRLTIGYYDGMTNNGSPVMLTNSSHITIGTAMSIAGPVSIYGGDIVISQNITSTLLGADVLLQGNGAISLASSKTIETTNGDITFRSNAAGTAVPMSSSTIGAITLSNGSSLLSNGGNITLGGNFNGTKGSGLYAASARVGGSPGILISNATLNGAGGNINIYGRCTTSYDDGVRLQANISTTGTGNIGIFGDSYGGLFSTTPSSNNVFYGGITFINASSIIETDAGNINIEAKLTDNQNNGTGVINFYRSTGSENQTNHINVLSKTGDITIFADKGTTGAYGLGHSSWGNVYFGSPANNSYTATGDIKFTYSRLVGAGLNGFKVKSTGNVTYEPLSTSFDAAQTFPPNANYTLAESAASLTIGKAGNSADITISSAQSIAGDIDIYAGTLTLNGNLTTTNNGDITINSNNAIGLSAPRTVTAAGLFSYIPQSASFSSAVTYPMTNLTLTSAGLLIGKTTNESNVTMNTTTINGPITVYGGNISLNQNLNTTGGGVNGDVLVKASGNIVQASTKSITTSGGDATLWADSDGNGVGYINIAGGLASGISTGGGAIFLGGGTDLATGYARGSDEADGEVALVKRGGIQLRSGSVLNSGGGNITLRGQNSGLSTGEVHPGIIGIGTTINAGSGKVAIYGKATGSGSANAQAISREGNENWIIRSSNASADAIQLIGDASGCVNSGTSLGINFIGTIESTGGGGIYLYGSAGSATVYDHGLDIRGSILANSGTITLKGENNVATDVSVFLGTFSTFSTTLGSKANTNVTASTSPIIIQGDNIDFNTLAPVNTTGSLTIEPVNTSFSSALSFPISNLTVANTIGGLTLGKTGNASNITIGAATSVNGPITLHGADLTLNAGLTTTNNATGDITFNGAKLLGASPITLATGRTMTANLSGTSEFTGNISGTTISLTKTGTGTLTLNPTNALVFETATLTTGGLTIAASKQLTVNSTLTNNGTFTMKDGATFVQATSGTSITGTGTYNVEKALAGNSSTWSTTSGRFWYMGVPMVNVARSSFGTPEANSNRLWSYSETGKLYTELSNANDLLSAGIGYVHRRSTDGTLTFSATGANGLYGSDYSVSGLTKTAGYTSGVNLVSNPYMAYLDWVQVVTQSPTIDPTFYIRSNNVGGGNINALISYNANTPTVFTNTSSVVISDVSQIRHIAPMQSIWVKVAATASTGTINMTRSMLSHQTGNTLKSSTVFPTLAKVNLVDGNQFDQLLVFMNSDMSNEVDQYDSEKFPVSGTVQVYTMASNKKLVMNGLKNNKKKVSVPLYLELPETKSYTLNLAEYVLDNGLILLEDKQEGTMQDLTLLENYTFYANSGTLQNRFVLHFILPDAEFTTQGPSNSWVGPETSYTEGGDVQITNDDRGNIEITVDQPEEQKVEGNVCVTDMNGKEVYKGQLDGITTAVELNVPAGIYYLTVQSGALFEKKKVFIQN
jgi:hypothetical protein